MTKRTTRIRIQQQLVMVEAMATLGVIRTMGAIAVKQPSRRVGQIAVPDLIGVFGHPEPGYLMPPRGLEQTKVDMLSVGREHCEVDAKPVPCRTKRIGAAGLQPIGRMPHLPLQLSRRR